MALRSGKEWYTYVTYYENGNVFSRRVHCLNVQDRLGRTWSLSGRQLPDSITIQTGATHKGEHLASIIGCPDKVRPRPAFAAPRPAPWPTGRDVVSMVVGYFGFSIFSMVVTAYVMAH